MKKLFIEKSQINANKIKLNTEQINHIRALRLDKVIICDGEFDYDCDVIEKQLIVNNKNIAQGELGYDLTLYICCPKGDKLKNVVEIATELGATKIVPVISEYVQLNIATINKKYEKLSKIAYEAAGLAGRGSIPEILKPISFEKIFENNERIILAYEKESKNKIKPASVKNDRLGVVVGSEGGFSLEEVLFAEEKGAEIVSLGERILKVEVAVANILSVVIHTKGL